MRNLVVNLKVSDIDDAFIKWYAQKCEMDYGDVLRNIFSIQLHRERKLYDEEFTASLEKENNK